MSPKTAEPTDSGESGQATTEYVVLLGVVTVVAMVFFQNFGPFLQGLGDDLGEAFESRVRSGIYYFPR